VLVLVLGLGFGLACLPPATVAPPSPSPAASPAPPVDTAEDCLVWLDEYDWQGQLHARELRWGPGGVRERSQPGFIVGDGEQLFELTLAREPYDASELYGRVGEAEVRCEEPVVSLRKLPDGVAQPTLSARPSCTGVLPPEQGGGRVELRSTLEIISVLGPFIGWREQVDGREVDGGSSSRVRIQTLDVRSNEPLAASVWLRQASLTMLEVALARAVDPNLDALACELKAAPSALTELTGFAIAWSGPEAGGPRLRVGYRCCGGQACELDDPLPDLDPELGRWLPDPDGLLHSPYGCGSLGLDGTLRSRTGDPVGVIELDPEALVGVVFVPPG
jgi:hypothetical protein